MENELANNGQLALFAIYYTKWIWIYVAVYWIICFEKRFKKGPEDEPWMSSRIEDILKHKREMI